MRRRGQLGRGARRALGAVLLAVLAACGGGQGETAFASAGGTEEPGPAAASPLIGVDGPAAGPSFAVAGQSFDGTPCAAEGGQCVFTDQRMVAYGAIGQYIVKQFTGGAACNNATFGETLLGVAKQCFLGLAVASAGTPASSAMPGPMPPGTMPVVSPAPVPPALPAPAPQPMPQPTPAPAPLPPATPVPPRATSPIAKPTPPEAARFLVQATYGPTLTEIDRLAGLGYAAWLDEQFVTAPMDTHWAYVQRRGPIGCNPCKSEHINAVMESFWMQAVRGPDQLRQRTVFALSQIFVVSTVNTWIATVPTAHAAYLDTLSSNAFANFRTLLEQVALHPSMGAYLSHMGNLKEDPSTGRLPDENFARELMQLFSIGLWELNEDGSRKLDAGGHPVPTYSQADIMGMAKVFTGWSWGNGDWSAGFTKASRTDPYERAFNQPMMVYSDRHSTSEKRLLRGVVIPAGTPGQQSLKIALDTLFNHPNVGPFIGSQLIKRLVTSNPSPAYIRRVTLAFNDNGNGVRGDMKAVIRAVLLDPEARDMAKLSDPEWGKLREPMIRYANFMRAFNVRSSSGLYKIWNLEDTLSSLGQNPIRAPSVFNWFRPDYSPPGSLAGRGLVAPEFQITHETTITGYANYMAPVAERQNTWFRDNVMAKYGPTNDYLAADYSAEMALARNTPALIDRLNLLLMSGQMSPATRSTILEAVNATPADANAGLSRVAYAVFLIFQSPEYIVQK